MNLQDVVEELAACNDAGFKQLKKWPKLKGFDFNQLEEQASRLDEDEVNLLCDGEQSAVELLVESKDIHELDSFLDKVFSEEIPIFL